MIVVRCVCCRRFGRTPVVASLSLTSLQPYKKEVPREEKVIAWREDIELQRKQFLLEVAVKEKELQDKAAEKAKLRLQLQPAPAPSSALSLPSLSAADRQRLAGVNRKILSLFSFGKKKVAPPLPLGELEDTVDWWSKYQASTKEKSAADADKQNDTQEQQL